MKKVITLGLVLSFLGVSPCLCMETLFKWWKAGKSVYNESDTRTSLGLERKEEIQFNLAGAGISLIAAFCATEHGLNNLFKKDSSKLGALLSLMAGIGGIGYNAYNIYLHGLSYRPYIEK